MSGLAELSQTPFILIAEDVLASNDLSCLSAVDSAHDELAFVSLRGEDVIDHKEILISTASCRPSEQTDHWKRGSLVSGESKLAWMHALLF